MEEQIHTHLKKLKNIYWQTKLKDWYVDRKSRGIHVPDEDICTQAFNFRAMYGDEYGPFTVTASWLSHWKKVFGIENVGKSGGADHIEPQSRMKKRAYSFKEKLKILKQLETESFSNVRRKFKLPDSVLRSWIKQRDLIQELAHNSHTKNRKKKNSALGIWQFRLKDWYLSEHSKGIKVSDRDICIQALNYYKVYGGTRQLVLDENWLCYWKKTLGIKQLTEPEEKIKVNITTEEKHEGIPVVTISEHEYNWCQIFYYGESNFYYRKTSDKNVETISENVAVLDMLQDYITIGICTNADGSLKLPLTPVGRWQSSGGSCSELRDQSANHDQDHYRILMNPELFEAWIKTEFVRKVEQFLRKKNLPLNVLLITDNASTLAPIHDAGTWFSPLSVTLVTQAVSPDILVELNLSYQRKLAEKITKNFKLGVMKVLSDITLLDAMKIMTASWKQIRSDVIHYHWRKMWPVILRCIESSTNNSESIAGYGSRSESINAYHRSGGFIVNKNANGGHTNTAPIANSINGHLTNAVPAADSVDESHTEAESMVDINIRGSRADTDDSGAEFNMDDSTDCDTCSELFIDVPDENHVDTEPFTDSTSGNPLDSDVIIDSTNGTHKEQIS